MENIAVEELQKIRDYVKTMQSLENTSSTQSNSRNNFAGMAYTR